MFDRVASYLVAISNSDGGWSYRPGTDHGEDKGRSNHNMTLAAVGTLSISRLLLFSARSPVEPPTKKFGVLQEVEAAELTQGGSFPGYKPTVAMRSVDQAIDRGMDWNRVRFSLVPPTRYRLYYYYTLERAAALSGFSEGWYTTYGDALLKFQKADGAFDTPRPEVGPAVATSFAILYFMRSTQQILDNLGTGIMKGGRDLSKLFDKKEAKKDIGPLDALLAQMEKADLSALDNIDTDAVVEKIAFGSKEELIGQVDLLKKLLKHPDASNRQTAYFALGRTGDFSLIPEMLQGLRDPNLDVNVEALMALRYISRKPNGFGISLQPLAGAETADEKRKVQVANAWRTKAFKAWGNWYRQIRPYEEGGGFDELELMANPGR